MPDAPSYEAHLSVQAAAFLVTLPRREQRLMLDLGDQLARDPFKVSDFQLEDSTGRKIDNLTMDEFLFSYWIDHATKEVRITEIIKL